MVVDIVTKSRPFNDPKTKLLLEENTAIEITFKNILEESGNKIN